MSNTYANKVLLLASYIYGATILTGEAAAQSNALPDPTSQVSVAAPDPASSGLGEIVVTAQRRTQNLQDVPVAVTAVSGAQIAAANVTTALDLGRLVPSLDVFTTGGTVQPFLRGIGNPGSVNGNEASVAVYLDDVYVARLPESLLELNSISRVEVLKGPQGTLFGRNASGGLIHIVTRDPSENTIVQGRVGYSNYDTFRGDLYASTGLAKGLAIDVSGLIVDQAKGWGHNFGTGRDWGKQSTKAIRSKLRWEVTPNTTVVISGDYSYSNNDFLPSSQYRFGVQRGYQLPPFSLQPKVGFYDIEADTQPLNTDRDWGVSARVDQKLSFATLTSITAYRKDVNLSVFDADFSKQPGLRADLYGRSDQFSEELQLASRKNARLDWIVGFFYLDSTAGYYPTRFTGQSVDAVGPLFGAPPGTKFANDAYGVSKDKSYAGYGQATYHLPTGTGLTLGARYTKDDLNGTGRTDLYAIGTPPFTLSTQSAATSFDKFTYKASVDQKLMRDVLVYASQSRGYKAGVYNTLPFSPLVARPEVLDSTEIGFKSELFDRKLRLNGAGFRYVFHNAQFQQFNGPTVVLVNAERAQLYGGEIEGEALLVQKLHLRFGAGYLDGHYTNFKNAQTPVPNPNVNPALGPVGGYINGFVPFDASASQLIRAPTWSANAGLDYDLETHVGAFDLNVNYSFTDSFAWDADNVLREPSRSLLDAQVKYTLPGEGSRFSVRLWAKNITQTRYYVAEAQSDGARGSSALPGAPRTFGFDWLFKF